ncbi:hypothetical protein NSB25_08350 [Acetatifactor muris]|uniref:Uncharacterized protein n=1 Tax=Acetatifactor muris TaxID=879566 RepID=A0A2K4ZF64_9FIRM|nr:hypothetical protein [Acetatifactor muris]MCR2047285.1 hypothetical protein [Acetatifactor muris]SOY29091.1 hypothetical protein AMURIS_01806 [Acetatifactor muris]
MNLGFLASFITFSVLISYNVKKQARKNRSSEKDFWTRESQANSVRRKPLDNLNYVTIPLEKFPTHLMNENADVMECIGIVESLASRKTVNLTGWSNTDLKLEYGTANITVLSEYDQNYTLLVRTLQKWSDLLLESGYDKEASVLLEFAVSTNTDISRTYYQLADYWISQGESFRIERLIRIAEGLRSASKDSIIRHLRQKLKQSEKQFP